MYLYIKYLPGYSRTVKCVPKFNQIYYEAGHTSLIFGRSYSERSFEYIHNILYIRVFIYIYTNIIYIYIYSCNMLAPPTQTRMSRLQGTWAYYGSDIP